MSLEQLAAGLPWGPYALVFVTPFVQEDAAVLAAASASVGGMANSFWLFVAIVAGLSFSDLWKYWIGRLAHQHPWAQRMAAKPAIAQAQDKVLNRLGITLFIARFVPGTRIPLYIASGYFRANFWRFSLYVIASGILYVGLAFGLFHLLGAVAGKELRKALPLLAVVLGLGLMVYLWLKGRRKSQSDATATGQG
jgi:membrane protein DedA with SNARE-associated domain